MNEDKKSKILGITVTVLLHIILALLLWFCTFGIQPKEEESGILVMVGVDAEGGGQEMMSSDDTDLQPDPQPEDVPPTPPAPSAEPAPVTPQPQEPVLTQEGDDAPYAAQQEELKKLQEEEARIQAENERQQEELRRQQEAEARRKAEAEEAARRKKAEEEAKRKAIQNQMAGLFNANGNSQGQTGLQGSPEGNSATGAPSGSPGYGDYDLGGRGILGNLPRPGYNTNASGKVVVYITVDAAGTVKSASIGKGTTTSNNDLREAAKQAALKARFKAIGGTSLTAGTITYYFDSNN